MCDAAVRVHSIINAIAAAIPKIMVGSCCGFMRPSDYFPSSGDVLLVLHITLPHSQPPNRNIHISRLQWFGIRIYVRPFPSIGKLGVSAVSPI
jgi:hypothetical protein